VSTPGRIADVSDERIYANGVNGLTGEYLIAPLAPSEVAARARQGPDDPDQMPWLTRLSEAIETKTFGPRFDLDPEVLSDVGWAVVFSEDEDPAVREALAPLVVHRRGIAGEERTKVLDYSPGESWTDWLARHRTAPGNVDPRKVPYYVLLVGSPERIPFSFQYLLDVEYAVGRLDLDDPGSYGRYAAAIVEHEQGGAEPRDATATFFGTRHAFDGATQLSSDSLVTPLAAAFETGGELADAVAGYRVDRVIGEPATKSALGEVFSGTGGAGRPALFFSATHGMGGWPVGDPDQAARHGALLCQDWPGAGQISENQYFAASDLAPDSDVQGMMAFFFACYGAGTPHVDDFHRVPGQPPPVIAEPPFVARLPKVLLSAGAHAVIGHVERAWGYSFFGAGESQLIPFQNALGRTLVGQPVGHAMKDFNEKYAALSNSMLQVLDEIERGGKVVPDAELARLWTERNDAQNYVVLGDPASRLARG
jgi:hypothetical protein